MYSDPGSIHCHRVRLVLAEKNIQADIEHVDLDALPEDLRDLNPQASLPTIVDRDLVLYDARVIIDYLDERYPHPPLMPADPKSRARTRLALYRIEADWYSLRPQAGQSEAAQNKQAKQLVESLSASVDVFRAMPYFLSESYSVLDATLAPLLWRLPSYGIVVPEVAAPVMDYARRLFSRAGFVASLSLREKEMGVSFQSMHVNPQFSA